MFLLATSPLAGSDLQGAYIILPIDDSYEATVVFLNNYLTAIVEADNYDGARTHDEISAWLGAKASKKYREAIDAVYMQVQDASDGIKLTSVLEMKLSNVLDMEGSDLEEAFTSLLVENDIFRTFNRNYAEEIFSIIKQDIMEGSSHSLRVKTPEHVALYFLSAEYVACNYYATQNTSDGITLALKLDDDLFEE